MENRNQKLSVVGTAHIPQQRQYGTSVKKIFIMDKLHCETVFFSNILSFPYHKQAEKLCNCRCYSETDYVASHVFLGVVGGWLTAIEVKIIESSAALTCATAVSPMYSIRWKGFLLSCH